MNLAYRLAAGQDSGAKRLPGSLHVNRRLSQWLRVRADGVVEVTSGKVEIGQGITTALAQIAAGELDVALARIRMVPASTPRSPDEAVTSGSLSIQESGTALRHACAEMRSIYLASAAASLGVEVDTLRIEDGEIIAASGARSSYWQLADDTLLDREASGDVAPKAATEPALAGRATPRLDLPDKIFGIPRFIQDLELPGMLHARVLRPASPFARLEKLDTSRTKQLPGVVDVVRDGNFAGVLAEREETAVKALARLALDVQWNETDALPDSATLPAWLKAQRAETKVVDERVADTPAAVSRRLRASYSRPYIAHASLSPSCALAQWNGNSLRVWTHSQGIYNLRTDLALAFALPPEHIIVEHVEGAGCYGHNGADDVAFDAALLARSANGRPVRVLWSRADELAWSPFGAAMAIELEADLDEAGSIVAWRHELWSNGHSSRPGRAKAPALLGAWHRENPSERLPAINPPLVSGGGADRNAVPPYDFPARCIVNHRLLDMPLRTSALRSLGAFANVFAVESFFDELARDGGEDPVGMRLRHLSDARARAVIEAVASRANWSGWQPQEGCGHGIGFARYKNMGAWCAVVAEVEAGREIRVRRLVVAVDVGRVVSPDGVANQIEGGAVQAASWTLKEAVRFDRRRVTSDSWEAYPILRFSEIPSVEVVILDRPEEPSTGAGEAAQGPVAAAIGNAVFDALGVRVRDLPITPEQILAQDSKG
ncbi:MAG: xanthine dehydrogenase family protein molybdopterin-binding subunit [Betaproteobacteria bacterium]|nr:xanthine dehydrogenase family protein molybdopterin-binding subunit [Betaproteobacteria bacterium]